MASIKDLETVITKAIAAHWSEPQNIPGEKAKRTRNQIFIWSYLRAGSAARDSLKALSIARAVAKRQGMTDDQLDDIEAKVDKLLDES